LIIAKHNIDDAPNTPTKYGVRGIPTMLLFKNGQLLDTKVGAANKSNIKEWLDSKVR
jgi:thioredoxin 1